MEMEVVLAGNKKVEAHWRGFTIKTDQPVESGGDNTAPSPFELFLASLATCAGFFVASFCQERGVPTENIRLVQRMERDPETHLVKQVAIDIQLPPDFPAKYRNAVVKAAETCTVKKHLHNPPVITVSVNARE